MSSLGDRQITPVEIKLCEASTHRSVNESCSTKSDLDCSAFDTSNNSSPTSGSDNSYAANILLAHKAHVLKKFPNPPVLEGFPPVIMMEADKVQKQIGYKQKRVPYRMRNGNGTEEDGLLSRDPSVRSEIGRDNMSTRSIPREMSRRKKMEERFAFRREGSARSFRRQTSLEPEDQAKLPPRGDSIRRKSIDDLDAFDILPVKTGSLKNMSRSNLMVPRGASDRRIPQFPKSMSGRTLQPKQKEQVETLHESTEEDVSPLISSVPGISVTKKITEEAIEATTDVGTDINKNDNDRHSSTSRERRGRSDVQGGRGRSESRGRSASRSSNASGKAFTSRKERAAFFIGLRSGSQSRSPSPWGRRDGSESRGNSVEPNSDNQNRRRSQSVDYTAIRGSAGNRGTSLEVPSRGRSGRSFPQPPRDLSLPKAPPGLSVQAPADDCVINNAGDNTCMSMEATAGTPQAEKTNHGEGGDILGVGLNMNDSRGRRESMDRLSLGRFGHSQFSQGGSSNSSRESPHMSLTGRESRESSIEAPEPVSFRRDHQFYGRDMTVSSPSVTCDSRTTSLQSAGGFPNRCEPPSRAPPPPPQAPPPPPPKSFSGRKFMNRQDSKGILGESPINREGSMRSLGGMMSNRSIRSCDGNGAAPMVEFGAMSPVDVARFSREGSISKLPNGHSIRSASPPGLGAPSMLNMAAAHIAGNAPTQKKVMSFRKKPSPREMPVVDEDRTMTRISDEIANISLENKTDAPAPTYVPSKAAPPAAAAGSALSADEMAMFLKLQQKLLGDQNGAPKTQKSADNKSPSRPEAAPEPPMRPPPGYENFEPKPLTPFRTQAVDDRDYSVSSRYDPALDMPSYYQPSMPRPGSHGSSLNYDAPAFKFREMYRSQPPPPPPDHAGSMSGSHSSHSQSGQSGSFNGYVPAPPPKRGSLSYDQSPMYNQPPPPGYYDNRRGSYEASPYGGIVHHTIPPRHDLSGRNSVGVPPPPPPPPSGRRGSYEAMTPSNGAGLGQAAHAYARGQPPPPPRPAHSIYPHHEAPAFHSPKVPSHNMDYRPAPPTRPVPPPVTEHTMANYSRGFSSEGVVSLHDRATTQLQDKFRPTQRVAKPQNVEVEGHMSIAALAAQRAADRVAQAERERTTVVADHSAGNLDYSYSNSVLESILAKSRDSQRVDPNLKPIGPAVGDIGFRKPRTPSGSSPFQY